MNKNKLKQIIRQEITEERKERELKQLLFECSEHIALAEFASYMRYQRFMVTYDIK